MRLHRFLFLLIPVIIICGCERSDDLSGDKYDSGGSSVTVHIENQSSYDAIVYKGDSEYARIYPRQSINIYSYLVGGQKLFVGIATPNFSTTESFRRDDRYSNLIIYNFDYDIETETY